MNTAFGFTEPSSRCRRRKLKCDRLLPCTQCQKSQRSCRYAADVEAGNLSDASDGEVAVDRAPKRNRAPSMQDSQYSAGTVSHSNPSILEDHSARIERLERMLMEKNSPGGDASSSTSSGHSHFAPAPALSLRGLSAKGGTRTRFFGPGSTRVLVNLFDEAKEVIFSQSENSDIRQSFRLIHNVHKAMQEEHRKAAAPIGVFVDSMTPIQKRMADILPSKAACDLLLHVYMSETETLYRIVHMPSFRGQYESYWAGNQQSPAFLPQLLSMLCIGYRFVSIAKGLSHNDRDGIHMPTACALVRAWLDSLRGKQLVEFSTLQTEILTLMAQRVLTTLNQETWTHLGLIVRMAMTMGLHRDPSEFAHTISPFWAELRRRLWTTIIEVDVYMSMQCNLPSCVRVGDYSCQPPRNLNDDELYPEMVELPPSKPIEVDTDCRMQVFAANSLAFRFEAVDMTNRIDSIRDYQQILDVANSIERVLEDLRYVVPKKHPVSPKELKRQWKTHVILDMNCRRPLLGLYRPFALTGSDAPQQIVTGYLRSCMILLSYLDDLDSSSADYQSIWHIHYVVLRQEIFQASFGVCYYMKEIYAPASSSRPAVVHESNARPGTTSADLCLAACQSSAMLSLPRLRMAVERAINDMTKRMSEIGMDLKDLIALMIVFNTSQGGTWEHKSEAIRQAIDRFLGAGLQTMPLNSESILATMPTMGPPPAGMQMQNFSTSPNYLDITHADMMAPNSFPDPDDFGIWDIEFWNPLMS
ncbi:hypothetical protein GGR57DRAFT_115327 [Xylariaceae sp. FL1272]|nr:hypothetical protein GGR57DRAFT_115327 [Xylariaceae sp. FL1272]